MRVLAVLVSFFVVAFAALSTTTPAFADPFGTASLSIVHSNQPVHFTVKGLVPRANVTVTTSTALSGQGTRDPSQGALSADANGNLDYVLYPYIVTPSGYAGPLFVSICDQYGNCVNFVITVRAERMPEPLSVGGTVNHGFQLDCSYLTRIGQGQLVQADVRAWLLRQDPTYLELLIANCGFTSAQQQQLVNTILEFFFGF